MIMWLLVAWGLINIFAVMLTTYWMYDYTSWDCVLIYPLLNEWLSYKDYNKVGSWFIRIAFSIVFLPYLVLHFVSLGISFVVIWVICGICDLFDLLFKKRDK